MVLSCADGLDNKVVAAKLGLNQATVSKWRQRFLEKRLEGLADEPRPGPVRTITDDVVEAVIVKTLEELPPNATHWSTRSLAADMGMSQSAVSRIWRAFGLKPHLVDSFKLSNDPQFIEKVRNVVGLYLNPPEAALVLCVDEKTQVQALDRTAPTFPMRPGAPARQTHDYVRNGTTVDLSSTHKTSESTAGSYTTLVFTCISRPRTALGSTLYGLTGLGRLDWL